MSPTLAEFGNMLGMGSLAGLISDYKHEGNHASYTFNGHLQCFIIFRGLRYYDVVDAVDLTDAEDQVDNTINGKQDGSPPVASFRNLEELYLRIRADVNCGLGS
jgi:hypothetical protein